MIIHCTIIIFALINGGISSDFQERLALLVQDVVNNYFMEATCLGIVTQDDKDILNFLQPFDLPVYYVHLQLGTLKNSKQLPDSDFEEYAWETPFYGPIEAGCLAFIVQTSEIKTMIKAFPRMFHNPKSVYRANRRYLYLPKEGTPIPHEEFEGKLNDLFRMREIDFMPDIVFAEVLKDTSEMNKLRQFSPSVEENDTSIPLEIELFSHKFIGTNPSEIVSLDVWNSESGFHHRANLYPDKVHNLMGKKITITGIAYEPLTVVDWDKDPSTYDGLDLQFFYEWARRMNLTWDVIHDDNFYGEIYENGSGNGALGFTSMDWADYVFCSTFIWEHEHLFVDYTTTFAQTTIVLVTPKPKLLPGWIVPVLPFDYSMWLAVLISIFLCATLLFIISMASVRFLGHGVSVNNMYSTWTECMFRTSGLLVLQVPPDERDWSTPRFVPMRHLVTWIILFYFVVTTAYGGGLATVLTVPRYEKPIETIDDLADREAKWTGFYDAYLFSIKDSVNPKLQTVVRNWRFGPPEWMESKTRSGDMSFALERMLAGNYFIPPNINEDAMDYLRIMKEDLYSCLCVYVVRKGSPLLKPLNTLLMRARDAGLYYIWEGMVVRKYMSPRRQLAISTSRIQNDDGPTKLQLHHIVGAFYMLLYGLGLGLVACIAEVIHKKYRQPTDQITMIRPIV